MKRKTSPAFGEGVHNDPDAYQSEYRNVVPHLKFGQGEFVRQIAENSLKFAHLISKGDSHVSPDRGAGQWYPEPPFDRKASKQF